MVQCKFQLNEKTELNYGGDTSWKLHFSPVKHDTFGKYTPSGNFEFITTNIDAANSFEVGKEYFVDIHE